jgi:hypothetical protein
VGVGVLSMSTVFRFVLIIRVDDGVGTEDVVGLPCCLASDSSRESSCVSTRINTGALYLLFETGERLIVVALRGVLPGEVS